MAVRYFVENIGTQTLGDELARLAEEGTATEHPQMKCLDRRGNQLTRNVIEVSLEVMERICRMSRSAGYQFVVFRSEDDLMPRENFSVLLPVRLDPFKEAKKKRRKLPKGVMRGSDLSVALSRRRV